MAGRVVSITLLGNDRLGDTFRDASKESDRLASSLEKLEKAGRIGNIVAAVAALGPAAGAAAASLAAAAGAVTAAFGAAGAAVGAFALAAQPQLSAAGEAMKAFEKVGAAKTPAEAAKATKEFNRQLAQLPPATQTMTRELVGLKQEHQAWSKALSGDTMPIFTKGLQAARAVLPKLTPLVKTAASALNDFMDGVLRGVKSKGFGEFTGRMNEAAKRTLPALLRSIKNVGKGLAGIFDAFLPSAPKMADGIENITEKFAKWGQSLKKSTGFSQFMDRVRQSAPQLLSILGNLVTILLHVGQAMAPLTPISLAVIDAFTKIIAAIPPPVLTAIVGGITAITVAMRIWLPIQKALNFAMAANPLGLVVLALAGLALGLVTAYKRSETFRRIVDGAWQRVQQVTAEAWDFIRPILVELRDFFVDDLVPAVTDLGNAFLGIGDSATGAAGKIGGLNFGLADIKTGAGGVIDFLRSSWTASIFAGLLGGPMAAGTVLVAQHWDTIKNTFTKGVRNIAGTLVANDIPQRLQAFMGNVLQMLARLGLDIINVVIEWSASLTTTVIELGGAILSIFTLDLDKIKKAWSDAGEDIKKNWQRFGDSLMATHRNLTENLRPITQSGMNGLRTITSNAHQGLLTLWRALPAKIRGALGNLGGLLRSAGRAVVQGLIDGIQSSLGKLTGLLGRVTTMIRDNKGPLSKDLKLLVPAGEAIMTGLMHGIDSMRPDLATTLGAVTTSISAGPASVPATPELSPGGAALRVVYDTSGADAEMLRLIRKLVRIEGSGSAQTAFGQ